MRNNPELHLDWHRSSYSGGSGGNCLEAAMNNPTIVPVRDSKNPHGPKLLFRADAWTVFVSDLKASPAYK
ncbi:DUF397 domain-containing protein [Streptomyces sp. NPDC056296]|uniref:DUF397 domain-containing protein n=1 Tax=Streptomyces sp. NPDC056296 TaxID=3345775 RepID=UPI0035DE0994